MLHWRCVGAGARASAHSGCRAFSRPHLGGGADRPAAGPVAVALDDLARIVQDNSAADMVFPTDPVRADSLKGAEDRLSNAIGKRVRRPYSKHWRVKGRAAPMRFARDGDRRRRRQRRSIGPRHVARGAWQKGGACAAPNGVPKAGSSPCRAAPFAPDGRAARHCPSGRVGLPNDRRPARVPRVEKRCVPRLHAIAAHLERRCDEAARLVPDRIDDHDEAQLLVIVEACVHVREMFAERGFERRAPAVAIESAAFVRQRNERARLREPRADHAARVDERMRREPALDRRRRDILALARLEDFLHPPGDLQAARFVELALVAAAHEAVGREERRAQVGALVIADRVAGRADLDLARVGEAALDVAHRRADVAQAHVVLPARMRHAAHFAHPIAFEQFEPEIAIPAQQRGLDRGGGARGEADLIEAELPQDHRLHRVGNRPRRQAARHRVPELRPQARHRDEERRPRALQIGDERIGRIAEVDGESRAHRQHFDVTALGHVRQRQIRDHPVVRADRDQIEHRLDAPAERAERQHHAFRLACRAGRVDDRRERVGRARHVLRERRGVAHDVVPRRADGRRIVQIRQTDAAHVRRHARAHRLPRIELADEQRGGFAMREHLPDRFRAERWIERHGYVAAQPDREIGEDPVRAVLRQDRDVRSARQIERAQIRGDAARLLDGVAPREAAHAAVGARLHEPYVVGARAFPVLKAFERQVFRGDRGQCRLLARRGARRGRGLGAMCRCLA
ncbi:hypothetical protein BURPS1710b_A1155 [Burkholderia pseudomallei 1710b]|uniref:Uncharacterized protein n=2 Tax=Burkholderia pseudomallei TaxID=28450 RepID=Q3JJE1_BURP1|nr:hypothetical protein BURPS1710b_A1155 [Burkholderia pseudomallei 1710b]